MTAKPHSYVIGDVHGCLYELEALLDRLSPGKHDRLYFLGDMVNVGPDSAGVVRRISRLPNTRWLMGNHELNLIRLRNEHHRPPTPAEQNTLGQLEASDWAILERGELHIELPEFKTVLVHGGFLPNRPWREQGADIVTDIQSYDPRTGIFGRRNATPPGNYWLNHWQGPPFVLCGHTPGPEISVRPWGCCIDTACVYGGKLTAYHLNTQSVIQVRARANYTGKTMPPRIK